MVLKKILFISIILKMFSMIVVFSSKSIMVIWLALEMNLCSTLPFLFNSNKFVKKILIYVLFKILGSMIFVYSSVWNYNKFFLVLGLFLKLSFFPFIFWMPTICSSMSWLSLILVLVTNKVPSLYLFKEMNTIDSSLMLLLSLMVFVVSKMLMFAQDFNMKSLVGWSSVVQTSVFLVLLSFKVKMFIMYFSFYSVLTVFLCLMKSYNSKNLFANLGKIQILGASTLVLFLYSGIPPFMVFFYKMMFFFKNSLFIFWVSVMILAVGFFFSFMAYMNFFLKKVVMLKNHLSLSIMHSNTWLMTLSVLMMFSSFLGFIL